MWFVDDRPRRMVVYRERTGCGQGCLSLGCMLVFYGIVGIGVLLGLAFVASLLA